MKKGLSRQSHPSCWKDKMGSGGKSTAFWPRLHWDHSKLEEVFDDSSLTSSGIFIFPIDADAQDTQHATKDPVKGASLARLLPRRHLRTQSPLKCKVQAFEHRTEGEIKIARNGLEPTKRPTPKEKEPSTPSIPKEMSTESPTINTHVKTTTCPERVPGDTMLPKDFTAA